MSAKQSQVKAARRQSATIDAYQNVFSGPNGDIVLKDLMFTHGVLRDNYTGDVNELLIREGERRVVLRILEKLSMDVSALKERIDKYANEEV